MFYFFIRLFPLFINSISNVFYDSFILVLCYYTVVLKLHFDVHTIIFSKHFKTHVRSISPTEGPRLAFGKSNGTPTRITVVKPHEFPSTIRVYRVCRNTRVRHTRKTVNASVRARRTSSYDVLESDQRLSATSVPRPSTPK